MPKNSWKQSTLWSQIDNHPDSEKISKYVNNWLDDVEILLSKSGTAPLSFTLHDDDHSFRVSQRMADLIPADTLRGLSVYELGLLLMFAYLHDIGMNPRRQIVADVKTYLGFKKGDLSSDEANELQRWLDQDYPGIEPPILGSATNDELIKKIDRLASYYCRHRHNDWSEIYIEELSNKHKDAPYKNWIPDLIALCKSHHYGYGTIVKDDFDIRIVGGDSRLVNLRYLACVLRLADVMENDPERTPSILLDHRGPMEDSEIYWLKDQWITIGTDKEQGTVAISSRTPNARIHKAVLSTVNAINAELDLCKRLDAEGAFQRGVKLDVIDHYRWIWPSGAVVDVKPAANSFIFIDGAFRPEPKRILTLLAGTQLYGSRLAALREILQNAADSVREQIGYEMISHLGTIDDSVVYARRISHRILVEFQNDKEGMWLICSDTGVGMTRSVFEKHLLVSGSAPRHSLRELARHCAARGVPFERSGEFGIGVLSYFMLADKLVIETRASAEAYADVEQNGYRFEILGIEGFGELSVCPRKSRGSTVKLRLCSDILAEYGPEKLIAYMKSSIQFAPCVVEFRYDSQVSSVGPGWCRTVDELKDSAMRGAVSYLDSSKGDLVSNYEEEEQRKQSSILEEVSLDFAERIDLHGPVEIKIGNYATVRVFLPFFNLSRGASLQYMAEDGDCVRTLSGLVMAFSAINVYIESWRGFSISSRIPRDMSGFYGPRRSKKKVPLIVELNTTGNATVSVARDQIIHKDQLAIENAIDEAYGILIGSFKTKNKSSPYWSLIQLDDKPIAEHWAFREKEAERIEGSAGERMVWKKIPLPAIYRFSKVSQYRPFSDSSLLESCGIRSELRPLSLRHDNQQPAIAIADAELRYISSAGLFDVAIVVKSLGTSEDRRIKAVFPPELRGFLKLVSENRSIFNADHPAFSIASHKGRKMFMSRMDLKLSELPADEIVSLDDPQFAAWLCYLSASSMSFWNGLRDKHPVEFKEIIRRINDICSGPLQIWLVQYQGGSVSFEESGAVFRKDELHGKKPAVGEIELSTDPRWWIKGS